MHSWHYCACCPVQLAGSEPEAKIWFDCPALSLMLAALSQLRGAEKKNKQRAQGPGRNLLLKRIRGGAGGLEPARRAV